MWKKMKSALFRELRDCNSIHRDRVASLQKQSDQILLRYDQQNKKAI